MAVFGYVMLGLLCALLLALCIPVRFFAHYKTDDPIKAELRWLFFKFDLTEAAEKKPEKSKKPAKPKKPKGKKSEKAKDNPKEFSDMLGIVLDLLQSVKGGLGMIVRNFRIYRARLYLTVAEEDAAMTAIAYGRVNAAVYSAYAVAGGFLNLEPPDIQIRPDFTTDRGSVDFEACGRLVPIVTIAAVIRIGCVFLCKAAKRMMINNEDKDKLGGTQNGKR